MLTKIFAGFLVATVLALGVVGWLYRAEIREGAATRAALETAVRVNADNMKALAAAKAEAAAERDRAIARQRERDGMASAVAALRQALGDSLGACKWTDEQAKALDEFGVKPQ